MNKIKEILVEPNIVYTGSKVKIKIKAVRGATYEELKSISWNELKKYTYSELKGE